MVLKKDSLTRRDQSFLQQISSKLRVDAPTGNSFLAALDKIVNTYPFRSHVNLDASKQHLNRYEIRRIFKKKVFKTKLYKCDYITSNSERKLVGLVFKTKQTTLYRSGKKSETIVDDEFHIFSEEGNTITFIGNEKKFKKFFFEYYHRNIFSDDRPVIPQDPKKLCNTLLLAGDTDKTLEIYQLQLNQTKGGKKLRIRVFSDSGALIENFKKSLLSEKLVSGLELKNVLSIGFKKGKDKTTLKISRINANQFLLKWKTKNQLSKELSNTFKISDSESIIFNQTTDAELISELFREVKLHPYAKNRIYPSILKDSFYSDLIRIDKNSIPSLDYESLRKKLQIILAGGGAKVEVTNVIKKCGLFFPSQNAKKSTPHKKLLVIKKNKRILQHLLLEHQQLYNVGETETLKQYFVFIPFLLLDFRKNQKEGYIEENAQDLLISSGTFISDLKNNPTAVSELVMYNSKKIIEDKFFEEYFKVASEILDNLTKINSDLDSQQKGSLFEALCFCILSRILLTKKIGNAYAPDGKFVLDDEKIVYDAKNLGNRANNPLLSSVTYKGKIKDIGYITKENVKNYIYIVNDISSVHFQAVKDAIESKCTDCKVSAITLGAIRDIVNIYMRDSRKISSTKLKDALLSGSLTSSVMASEIQTTNI